MMRGAPVTPFPDAGVQRWQSPALALHKITPNQEGVLLSWPLHQHLHLNLTLAPRTPLLSRRMSAIWPRVAFSSTSSYRPHPQNCPVDRAHPECDEIRAFCIPQMPGHHNGLIREKCRATEGRKVRTALIVLPRTGTRLVWKGEKSVLKGLWWPIRTRCISTRGRDKATLEDAWERRARSGDSTPASESSRGMRRPSFEEGDSPGTYYYGCGLLVIGPLSSPVVDELH